MGFYLDPMSNSPNSYNASLRGSNPKSLSIVVPCYNEEEVLGELKSRLIAVVSKLEIPYEIILVDDGSKDKTWSILEDLSASTPCFKSIRLSRNYGHQIALTCGLDQAVGEMQKALGKISDDPTMHDHLGDIYLKQGKMKEAIQQFEVALAGWKTAAPGDVDPAEVARVTKKLDGAKAKSR